MAQFESSPWFGVIPKPRAFTSGARDPAWAPARLRCARKIPSTSLRAGSSLRLQTGFAQDDAVGEESGTHCRIRRFAVRIFTRRIEGARINQPAMVPGASPEEHFPEYDFDPDKLNLRVRVTLAADRQSVDPVVDQVMESVRQMKCVDGKEDAIQLSLQEALANAVVHGAKEDPSKVVECLVACDEERGILIIVRDPGEGFDFNAIPSCTVGENLYSNHGRGIFLINQLMDEVQFHKNGTEIRMVKR